MSGLTSAELFQQVHGEFARRGLLGRALRLEAQGRVYSVRCDEACFTVYRVNDKPFLPPGLPGWTVCRLGQAECFSLDPGEAQCPLPEEQAQLLAAAGAWVEMVLARLNS